MLTWTGDISKDHPLLCGKYNIQHLPPSSFFLSGTLACTVHSGKAPSDSLITMCFEALTILSGLALFPLSQRETTPRYRESASKTWYGSIKSSPLLYFLVGIVLMPSDRVRCTRLPKRAFVCVGCIVERYIWLSRPWKRANDQKRFLQNFRRGF